MRLRRYYTGDVLGEIAAGLGSTVLAPAAIDALADPRVQQQIQAALEAALQADSTRTAIRPYLAEGAIWIAGGIAVGGYILSRLLRGTR